MNEEIGSAAGEVWRTLDARGELSVAQLKKAVKVGSPVFDWSLGWLAREDKIVINRDKRAFRVRLK